MAVAAARRQFDLIRKQYAELKPCMVLSLPGGQTGIDSPPGQILAEFPGMVVADEAKAAALKLLEAIEAEPAGGAQAAFLKGELNRIVAQLQYVDSCQVELRFSELKYPLIWRLQADEQVDRRLTPQTKASICIVLGTFGHLLKRAAREP
ncbi:MAG: hypothetical protein WCH99_13725 [Verrucomicrobiota bacterium]